jgi:hypothetical protein
MFTLFLYSLVVLFRSSVVIFSQPNHHASKLVGDEESFIQALGLPERAERDFTFERVLCFFFSVAVSP